MPNDQILSAHSERHMPATSPFELLAEELGAIAGRLERESAYRFAALMADVERKFAERELALERLQKSLESVVGANILAWDKLIKEKVLSLRDGMDGTDGEDGAPGEQGLQGTPGPAGEPGPQGPQGLQGLCGNPGERGEMGPAGKDGIDGTPGLSGKDGQNGLDGTKGEQGEKGETGQAGQEGPQGPQGEKGQDGINGKDGVAGADGLNGKDGVDGAPGLNGKDGCDGKLPRVKVWKAGTVHYDGDVVTHNGALWQASQDTAKTPGTNEWICLAMAGVDGKDGRDGEDGTDGRSLRIMETFDPTAKYKELDVVTLDQKWFVAKKDDPGPCPGAGWKAGPGIGKTGRPGDRGPQGAKGETGLMQEILAWDINRETYEVAPIMANGERGPVMQLRDLFAQFQEETV
jgi:hypothetical protein